MALLIYMTFSYNCVVDGAPLLFSTAEYTKEKPFYVGAAEAQSNSTEKAVSCYLLWLPGFRIDDKHHLAFLDLWVLGLQDPFLVMLGYLRAFGSIAGGAVSNFGFATSFVI